MIRLRTLSILAFCILFAACAAGTNPTEPAATATPTIGADNQDAIGRLNEQLERQEAETFAGLWIQNQPEYRVVVAFTHDGDRTIQKYVAHTPLAGLIQVRTAQVSLAHLTLVQQQLDHLIDELAWPFASSINIQMNQVDLWVTDKALMEADLRRAAQQLPDHVAVVVTYQPLGEPPPFPITPVPGLTMPRLRARSATLLTALAVGPLTLEDGCLRIGGSLIIWQPDYFANDNNGRIEILNREGRVVARVGEETRTGGGEVPLTPELEQQLREPIPAPCRGPYWAMGEIVTTP